MITPEEFKQRWGTKDMVKYIPELVNSLNIPEVSRQFLIRAGLPRRAFLGICFDLAADMLVPLTEAASLTERWGYGWRKPFPQRFRRYRLLARKIFDYQGDYFDEVYFCLDEQGDGKVVKIFNKPGYPVKLLNNTVPQLAEMLLLFEEHIEHRKTLDWENFEEWDWDCYYAGLQHLQHRLRSVDPDTLKDDGGWAEVIYRLEE